MKIAVAGATGLIGRHLVTLAEQQGHEVVALSRSGGYDLTSDDVEPRLREALAGADAVVDVTQGTSFDEAEAVQFFRDVAANLGDAATAAGVPRTVVLSIVGIERSPDYGYYVAKVEQEKAHRRHSPGTVVLRATQFHEFAGQMIDWFTTDGVADVMDVQVQPVESTVVVELLLELATAERAADTQLAGPQVENLVELSQADAERRGLDVTIRPDAAPASMRDGGMLPRADDHVVIRGRTWHEWAATL